MADVDWHKGELFLFDLETTGKEVEDDEPVTAALVFIDPGVPSVDLHLLADPGRDIHPEATRIHGITNEHARAHGRPLAEVLERICAELVTAISCGVPIVGMNLPFDFTIMDRACRRHGVTPLSDRVAQIAPVIDVGVLDNKVRPRRKLWEKRKLPHLCQFYGVRHGGAHDAVEDAKAAARVAYKLAVKHPELRIPLMELHARQIVWRRQQDARLALMFAELNADPATKVKRPFVSQPHWPIIAYTPTYEQPVLRAAEGSPDVLVALRTHFDVDLLGTVEEVR